MIKVALASAPVRCCGKAIAVIVGIVFCAALVTGQESAPQQSPTSPSLVNATTVHRASTSSPIASTTGETTASASITTSSGAFSAAAKIDEYVRATMLLQSIPGASVAVVRDGELVYANGYGVANRDENVAVTSETLFNIASITKIFTAVATLKLAEQGKVDLEAPIQTYVPEFPEKQWPVTIKALLSHQAGVRHYRGVEGISTARFADDISPLDIFKDDPLLHEPGTAMLYSSYGYSLLGAAINRATGKSFLEYVQEHLLKPSGVANIRVYDGTVDVPLQAVGYLKAGQSLRDAPRFDSTGKIPSGGLLASAADLGRFVSALQRGKLVNDETLEAMIEPQTLTDGKRTLFSLGWMIGYWGKIPVASFMGGQPGFSSLLFTIPDRKFAVVILTNVSGARVTDLAYSIRDAALDAQ